MSIITRMRRFGKSVFVIVAIVFIGGFLLNELWQLLGRQSGHKMLDKGVVGMVGKKKITVQEYRNTIDFYTVKFQTENDRRDLSPQEQENVTQQTWQYLTQEKTWSDVYKKNNIKITDAEIIEIMKANPPQELQNRPDLMTDGKFDNQKYQQYMFAPENRLYLTLYARDLADGLPKEKFRLDVVNSYRVTNGEINDATAQENTSIKLTYLYFGPKALQNRDTTSLAEIQAYYKKHEDKYQQKISYRTRYVFFPMTITSRDSSDAQRQIEDAYEQSKTDEFSLIIRDFSDAPNDSIASWVKTKDLDSLTRSAIRSLKNDSITPPFLTYAGWQVIKIDKQAKDSVLIRKVTKAIQLTRETESALKDSISNFISRGQNTNFDSLCQEYGAFARELPPMTKERVNFSAIYNPNELKEFYLSAKPNAISQPLKGRSGYYVFQLIAVEPAKLQPLDQVKSSIDWTIRRDKEKDLIKNYAETYLDKIRSHVPLESIARMDTMIEIHTEDFSSLKDCRNRKGSEFAGAAYALNAGETYGVLATDIGSFVIRCDNKQVNQVLTPDAYKEQRRNEVGNQVFQEAVKQPEITDYRDENYF
jgi:parvulin-like peptidyl-prolyl isomerase